MVLHFGLPEEAHSIFVNNITNLSGKYAYYIDGITDFDLEDFCTLVFCPRHSVNEKTQNDITYEEWITKFIEGTLSEFEINEIIEMFDAGAQNESLVYHLHVSKDDSLQENIEKVKLLLINHINEFNERNEDEEWVYSESDIANEALCHFYVKVGAYYIFGINLDDPLETYTYLTRHND